MNGNTAKRRGRESTMSNSNLNMRGSTARCIISSTIVRDLPLIRTHILMDLLIITIIRTRIDLKRTIIMSCITIVIRTNTRLLRKLMHILRVRKDTRLLCLH